MVERAAELLRQARSFHERQLATHRRVFRLGTSRIFLTTGQVVTTSGSLLWANSTVAAGMPGWVFWGVVVSGYLGGRFAFPIPDSSIASKRGPVAVVPLGPAQLDSMTPDEIRAYENNMVLQHPNREPRSLGTVQALHRHQQAVRAAAEATGAAARSLACLSLADAAACVDIAARHEEIRGRWLAYEVDPKLQIEYPAMSDISFPPTAAMIKAMRAADQAKTSANPAEYRSAVEAFGNALAAAEAAAGVTPS